MIVAKHATKSFATLDLAITLANFVTRLDDLIAQALVISLSVIVDNEFVTSISQRTLTEEYHSIEALRF